MEGLPTEESISNEASATFTGGYKGVLSCVKISNSGEMSKTTLFDCKKQGQLITLEQGEFLNSNTFVISSEMGPNSVTNRNKLCLIEFE